MYRRILSAIDGSGVSERALREAFMLAREGGGALRIVHVVDLVSIAVETPADWTPYFDALRAAGERLLRGAGERGREAGVNCETKLLEVEQFGLRPADEIVREAGDWRADLIVLGTHGRRGVSHLFLGSVAESVLRIAPVPVLLVRGG